jgi:hypothetical protein
MEDSVLIRRSGTTHRFRCWREPARGTGRGRTAASPRAVCKPLVIYWSYDAPTSELLDWNLAHLKDVALHFFTKTRWERMFKSPGR